MALMLSLCSSILLWSAFPPLNLWPLAWVALGAAMAAAAMTFFVLFVPPPGVEALDLLFQNADFIHTEGGLS